MNHVSLKSLLLKEQFHVSDMVMLEKACLAFADVLIKNNIVAHHHKDLTAADTAISHYSEDIAEVVRNEVIKWMDVANRRGGR
jgi:hypothetical protein